MLCSCRRRACCARAALRCCARAALRCCAGMAKAQARLLRSDHLGCPSSRSLAAFQNSPCSVPAASGRAGLCASSHLCRGRPPAQPGAGERLPLPLPLHAWCCCCCCCYRWPPFQFANMLAAGHAAQAGTNAKEEFLLTDGELKELTRTDRSRWGSSPPLHSAPAAAVLHRVPSVGVGNAGPAVGTSRPAALPPVLPAHVAAVRGYTLNGCCP